MITMVLQIQYMYDKVICVCGFFLRNHQIDSRMILRQRRKLFPFLVMLACTKKERMNEKLIKCRLFAISSLNQKKIVNFSHTHGMFQMRIMTPSIPYWSIYFDAKLTLQSFKKNRAIWQYIQCISCSSTLIGMTNMLDVCLHI